MMHLGVGLFLFILWVFFFNVLGTSAMSPSLGSMAWDSVAVPLLGNLNWVLQGCPLCGLCVPCCCSWDLIAVGTSVYGTNSQAGWLWGLAITTDNEQLGRIWAYRAGITSAGLWCLVSPPYGWPPGELILGPFCRCPVVGPGCLLIGVIWNYLVQPTNSVAVGSCLCWTWRHLG